MTLCLWIIAVQGHSPLFIQKELCAIMMDCFHMFSDYVHMTVKSNVQYHISQCTMHPTGPQAHTACRLNKTIIKVTLNMCTSCPLPHLSSLLAVIIMEHMGVHTATATATTSKRRAAKKQPYLSSFFDICSAHLWIFILINDNVNMNEKNKRCAP